MTLHIVGAADSDLVAQCCAALAEDDALLLLADGVYAALPNGRFASMLADLPTNVTIHAIAEDCTARGIAARLAERVTQTDYAGFVRLACEHPRSVSWF